MAEMRDQSPIQILTTLVEDGVKLARLQVELGVQEARELMVRNREAATMIVAGVMVVAVGVLAGIPALLMVLLPWHWAVATGWIIAYVVAAVILIVAGRARMRMRPANTLDNLEETEQWVLRQVRSFER